jgi:hypothetical protein
MSDFYLTLASGASMDLYPDNHASKFTNKFAEVIHLPPVNNYWEVGVANAILPAKYYNVTNDSKRISIRFEKTGTRVEEVPVYNYLKPVYITVGGTRDPDNEDDNPTTIKRLIKRINAKVPTELQRDFAIKYSETTNIISVQIVNQMIVRFYSSPTDFDVYHRSLKFPKDKIGRDLTESFDVQLSPRLAGGNAKILLDLPISLSLTAWGQRGTTKKERVLTGAETETLELPIGCYHQVDKLVAELKSVINASKFKGKVNFSFRHNSSIQIKCEKKYAISFPDFLAYILGYEQNVWYEGTNDSKYPLDLDHYLGTFYIYIEDLIRSQYIGDSKGPIIREYAPKKQMAMRSAEYPSHTMQYYPVATNEFQILKTIIVRDDGKLVSFPKWAHSVIKLHFRPKILDHY